MPGLPRPDAILFDWDNTLVDTWPCIIRAMNATLDAMGHDPWTEEEAQRRIARSLREAFPDLFGERWQEAAQIFYRTFGEVHLEMLRPLPGTAEMLAAFRDAGVMLGVVSNKTGRYLRAEADHLGWTPHFHRLIGAGDAPRDKPAVDVVHLALAESGIEPGRHSVWFVGDMAVDMQCARDSGCRRVLLRPMAAAEDEFEGCAPEVHLTSAHGLLQLFRDETVPNAAD
ncbi:HAD-IA family hydrolase [Caenispirillum bisanense]|uniref:HAD family hydrolase n=1 Tax=Caenispirillum bisanense TaxID=414052 RepID=UPI0031DAC5EC